MEEENKIRVVVKEVGKPAYETEIENSENAFIRFLDDRYIEMYPPLRYKLCLLQAQMNKVGIEQQR